MRPDIFFNFEPCFPFLLVFIIIIVSLNLVAVLTSGRSYFETKVRPEGLFLRPLPSPYVRVRMTASPLTGGLDPSLTSRYKKDVFFPLSFPNTILKNLLHLLYLKINLDMHDCKNLFSTGKFIHPNQRSPSQTKKGQNWNPITEQWIR